ncbi:class I SAM-dependent methyltransferase [Acidipropionibacterium jensenii]|uniref:class I SAM-dependent methyltransferase n=1 Tax=Acidipropionibacterium jensenii TaxID=1749 RepID=UPI002647B0B6|nr:methyltransferase domain-containing protein [Acidipropionibacterium jensenii]MDN5995618.1 class I SAM-dependent methyltransferase [Acidipropionibacterium jensenii]
MRSSSAPEFPPRALDWLSGGRTGPGARVLTLDCTPSFCRMLARRGVELFAVHRDPGVAAVCHQIPGATGICAVAESLPLDPCSFDTVLVHQSFHRLAPGLVLSEIARVLRPSHCIGVSWMTRDDSVPWVRRLTALLHTVDPSAMSGDYGTSTVEALLASKYFPTSEHSRHRVWVPVPRQGLVAMAQALPAVQRLDEDARNALLEEVEQLHQDSAGPGGLLLPYQLECWRAWVSHDELTASIEVDDAGLRIRL